MYLDKKEVNALREMLAYYIECESGSKNQFFAGAEIIGTLEFLLASRSEEGTK